MSLEIPEQSPERALILREYYGIDGEFDYIESQVKEGYSLEELAKNATDATLYVTVYEQLDIQLIRDGVLEIETFDNFHYSPRRAYINGFVLDVNQAEGIVPDDTFDQFKEEVGQFIRPQAVSIDDYEYSQWFPFYEQDLNVIVEYEQEEDSEVPAQELLQNTSHHSLRSTLVGVATGGLLFGGGVFISDNPGYVKEAATMGGLLGGMVGYVLDQYYSSVAKNSVTPNL